MEVRPIRPGEERAAGELVYRLTRGRTPGDAELTEFLRQAEILGTELDLQVVAVTSDGNVAGCAMYFPMLDKTGTATPPMCAPGFDRPEVQVELMRVLCSKARRDGVLILQAFCNEGDSSAEEILTQSGFDVLAMMLFMERRSTESDRNIEPDKRIRWVPYSAGRHADFVRTVERSYEGTLDCSKLGEIRDVNLTLETYRGRGEFDPDLWLLGEIEGDSAAVMLFIYHPDQNSHEVAYVAVVPEHRGKGLGRKVMEKGLKEVALRAPDGLLSLAVDEANAPAVKMYLDIGFTVVARRRVYFALLATS